MSEPESEIVLKFDTSLLTKADYDAIPLMNEDSLAEIIGKYPRICVIFENRIGTLEQERWDIARKYKKEKSRKLFEAYKNKELRNDKMRDAWIMLQDSVDELKMKEFACVTELKQVRASYEGWKAAFIAARKLETRIQQANQIEIQSARYIT